MKLFFESSDKKNICCICGKEFDGYGNNPYPYKEDGICCKECNMKYVIPARIKRLKSESKLTESLGNSIIEIAKNNGYFNDAIDDLESILEQDTKGRWCYPRMHRSGRDFYDYVPLDYITEDEQSELLNRIIEDDLSLDDYDWEGLSIDEVLEELWDNSEDLFYAIIDELS